MPETYNGHPSYDHWNVALWFANDEPLYRLAMAAETPDYMARELSELGLTETPDGVGYTSELIDYGWRSVDEDREEDA